MVFTTESNQYLTTVTLRSVASLS